MSAFIHDDFLLKTKTARRLYHEHAAGLPIIDYHCHLDPAALAGDRTFENITQAWIASDPYKHRAMRIAGVPERCITGEASDREKFDCWAATVPLTLGNPLFHWTALELKRFFGVSEILSPESSNRIWAACNERLAAPEFTARQLLARANVERLCTSDLLLDGLAHHRALARSDFATQVSPSLRPDDLLDLRSPEYAFFIEQLGAMTGIRIDSYDAFRQALRLRLDEFARLGCRLIDISITSTTYGFAEGEAEGVFQKLISGQRVWLNPAEWHILVWDLVRFLALECARRDWVMMLHLGAQRQTSSRLRALAGPAGGYATIGQSCDIAGLCRFLDELEQRGGLPRTILYNLNPADNAALATLTGSFAEDGVRGKIQFGPAWWYNDHLLGIRQHLEALASYGLLGAFVGMTTDSRSLLSASRHEYFRRALCDFLGEQAEAGLMPDDDRLLGGLVRAIAYDNPRQWIFSERD